MSSTIEKYFASKDDSSSSNNPDNATKRPLSSSSDSEQPATKKMCSPAELSVILTSLTEKIDAIAIKQHEITDIKSSLGFISDQFEAMRAEREADRAEIAALKNENDALKKSVEGMVHRVDCNQQYSRRNCLIVHGLPDAPGVSADDRVITFFRDSLDIEVDIRDIDRSHPLPSTKKKPVIVKFVRYNVRHSIFVNKKKLKGSGVSITESLTARRLKVMNEAKEKYGFRNVWSMDGKILCKENGIIKVVLGI